MKSKLFKRTVASLSALAMVSATWVVPMTASADERTYTVLYSQDYESGASDWTTSVSGRYTPVIQTDGTNHWQGVTMSERNNNGAALTSPNYSSYVSSQDEYALEFDAALGYTNGNQNPSFSVNTGDGYLLRLTTSSGTNWVINGSATDALTFASSGYTTGDTSDSTWYHYTVIYKDGDTHLKVADAEGNAIFGPSIIVSGTNTGKLSTISFATARYNSNFEIDNVVIRTLDDQEELGSRGVEALNDIAFTSQLNTTVTQPAEGEPVHLPITVKATGIYGSDLSNAEGIDIKWTITGLDNEDGYISLTKEEGTELGTVGESPDGSATAYFNVRNGVSNWFGSVNVTVTYLEKELTISTPFAVIGASGSGTNIAPAAGYPENMSSYDDALVGYVGTSNGINTKDLVLNSWSMYGSNGTRSLSLQKDEDGTKYIRFAINGGSGSAVPVYQLANQASQYIVDAKVRFTGGSMAIGHYNNTPNNATNGPSWTASYGSGALSVGTQSISGLNQTDWFRIVISADESAGTYWAKVYNNDGILVGETSDEPLAADASSDQRYFCFQGTYPLDLASFRIYYPTPASLTINSDAETIQVPGDSTPATANLSAVLKDTDGYNMSGAVSWSLADEYAGVSIDESGVLSVTNEAGAGAVTVVASFGGTRTEKEIALSTTGNGIAFTSTASSITIPFEGEENAVGTVSAEARNKDGDKLDANVTYELVDASGEALTGVRGVSFDAAAGVITVEPGAASKVAYVKATAVVDDETLTARTKVNIHGLSFAFGSDAPADDSYTQVTSADTYSDKLGYGFVDSTTVADEANDVKGKADYRFKAKVPNGNYVVNVETSAASVTSEVVESVPATTGITKSGSSFNAAVCDGVLDLTFPADSTLTTLSIAQAAPKTALAKPMVYAIGDSTTNNTGNGALSWGNAVSGGLVAVPEVFSGFSNNGMAGRDSVNFYNQGRVENVLLAICPGDYVTVNMGINSKETGEPASYYTLLDKYYVDGIIQRGAIPVILTATPGGPTRFYDNGTFTSGRGDGAHNNDLRAIAAAKDLDLIELGQHFEDIFNAYTDEDVAAYNEQNSTDFASVYDMVNSWYPDHNHYYAYLGTMIGEYVLGEIAKLAEANPQPTTEPTQAPTAEPTDAPTQEPTNAPTQEPTNAPTAEPTQEPAGASIVFDGINTVTVNADAENAVLLHAKYSGGRLVSADKTEVTLTDGTADVKKTDIALGDKLMLWKSMASQEPLAEYVVVDSISTPSPESQLIWRAENVDYTAGQDLGNGLSLVFGTGSAAPVYSALTKDGDATVQITKEIGGIEFAGYVSSGANGSWKGTSIDPEKTTAIKYAASADGVLTVYFDKIGSGKKICVGEEGMSKADIEAAGTEGTDTVMAFRTNVSAGHTYYIYVAGSKGRFCGVGFNEGAAIEEPEATDAPPKEISETEWTVSSADNGAAAGTELMKGLTTLFTNTCTNGKYISSGDNGSYNDGAASGTALKYAAEKNGTLSVSFIDLGADKTVYIVPENSKQSDAVASYAATQDKDANSVSADVTAGTIYYIYGAGTKARFTAASFTEGEPSAPEREISDYEWKVSAADNGAAAGTELMTGLTTIFDNTATNGKYISSGDDGKNDNGTVSGTALKYTAFENGLLTISFIDLGAGKTVYVVEDGGKQADAIASTVNESDTDKLNGSVSVEVTAGTTYFIYGAGTKVRFTEAAFLPAN